MSVDSARRMVASKESKLAELQKKLAAKQGKLAETQKKANDAREAANKTRIEATRRSKLRTYESASKDIASISKDIAQLHKQIVGAEKDLQRAKASLAREEKSFSDKQQREAQRESREMNQRLSSMSGTLYEHENRIDALECESTAVTVLYLGVSPEDAVRLRTDEEARDIREAIRLSDNPDSIAFEDRWATRQNDLLQALNEVNPEIVHFSGHGAEDGSLAIEDSAGKTLLVSKDVMAAVIEAAAERVRLVVFNACFSDEQADKILEHVDAVIGMSDSISDEAALAFARQLYSSIGFGLSLAQAFKQARAAIALVSLDEIDTPQLRVRPNLTAEEIVFVS
ncbi:CHAT domain-containing protein [Paratractidigestivibacter faecalis]|uniref:CHAT domain-containing protein n=1 Tax=Paratractidigestivibacter faecalis TaxID=2292441 RepID=UPI003D085547